MKKAHIFFYTFLFVIFTVLSIAPDTIYARPGGGHSYENKDDDSKSSSSSNSSSNYNKKKSYFDDVKIDDNQDVSDVEVPKWVYWAFGVVFGTLALFIIYLNIKSFLKKNKKTKSKRTKKNRKKPISKIEQDLLKLKKQDPNFSETLFFDFVSSLFTKYHSFKGKKEFVNLTPFLLADEIKEHSKTSDTETNEIVIGSINFQKIKQDSKTQSITVDINANYTISTKEKDTRFAVIKRWTFKRDKNVLSSEPDKIRELACPNCGANADFTDTGICNNCGTLITSGKMQWFLSSQSLLSSTFFQTKGLAHYSAEKGTKSATVYNKNLKNTSNQFVENHKLDWNVWETNFKNQIAANYFNNIYAAWSKNKLNKVRNLLSDRLYSSFLFWISAYKEEGLTNKLDKVTVKDIHFAKLDIDKFYEAATVRIFASAYDYVENERGEIIGGSKKRKRNFSEYWTFIRRTGVEKDTYNLGTCPNCGAPADKMGQSGICEYCNSKISNGDFSWVLSVITQDEVYKG